MRQETLNSVIIAYLNINSLRNKFDLLGNQIIGNVDVLVISETKLDALTNMLENFLFLYEMIYRLNICLVKVAHEVVHENSV